MARYENIKLNNEGEEVRKNNVISPEKVKMFEVLESLRSALCTSECNRLISSYSESDKEKTSIIWDDLLDYMYHIGSKYAAPENLVIERLKTYRESIIISLKKLLEIEILRKKLGEKEYARKKAFYEDTFREVLGELSGFLKNLKDSKIESAYLRKDSRPHKSLRDLQENRKVA